MGEEWVGALAVAFAILMADILLMLGATDLIKRDPYMKGWVAGFLGASIVATFVAGVMLVSPVV